MGMFRAEFAIEIAEPVSLVKACNSFREWALSLTEEDREYMLQATVTVGMRGRPLIAEAVLHGPLLSVVIVSGPLNLSPGTYIDWLKGLLDSFYVHLLKACEADEPAEGGGRGYFNFLT